MVPRFFDPMRYTSRLLKSTVPLSQQPDSGQPSVAQYARSAAEIESRGTIPISCARTRLNPALLGMSAASLWGTHDLIAGVTSRRIGFLPTVLGSTLSGFVVLTVWLGIGGTYPSILQDGVWIAYCSGLGYTLATMFLFAALSSGPMALGVPLAGSYPVTSLVLAALSGVPPSFLQVLLALVVVAGVVIVSVGEDPSFSDAQFEPGWFKRTVMYGIGAHLFFALGIWWGQSAATTFGSIETTWLARTSGLLLLLVLFAFSTETLKGKARFAPVLLLIGCLDVLAISSLNFAGHTSRPETASVIGSTFGPVTVLLAWVFLKERITAFRWIGIAITFSGVAALTASG